MSNPQTTPSGVVIAVINIEILGWTSSWKGSVELGGLIWESITLWQKLRDVLQAIMFSWEG